VQHLAIGQLTQLSPQTYLIMATNHIKTSEATKLAQEKAELKQLCDEFAQQVANILRMPSENAQQALNIVETLAVIKCKVAALSNYGGAGALAAVEIMSRITEVHQEFVSAVADGWHTTRSPHHNRFIDL